MTARVSSRKNSGFHCCVLSYSRRGDQFVLTTVGRLSHAGGDNPIRVELVHLEGPLHLCARCNPGRLATYWTRDHEEPQLAQLYGYLTREGEAIGPGRDGRPQARPGDRLQLRQPTRRRRRCRRLPKRT